LVGPQVGRFVRMVWMGIEHIGTGYDHLAFLFGLVLVAGRLRDLLTVISAFTIAHSITLAVAALGIWTPPARVVEPAIALSIAYVGVENFFIRSPQRRWRVTLPFGLVHGFGFASALRDVALPPAEVPWALLSFNLGVEIGQVAVIAALLPLLGRLRSWEAQWDRGKGLVVHALNAAVVALGGIWFVARVF
ncbi:MAG: HupE/UreJ family protein, partial [Polyangiaceae bacterium]|nr:HupE/UreJ family protein [Polyangiaceae bacterium]